MRWPWHRRRPQPPENVCLRLVDGTLVGPLPLRYDGRGVDGCRRWSALIDDSLIRKANRVQVDLLPARTSVALTFLPSADLAEALEELGATR